MLARFRSQRVFRFLLLTITLLGWGTLLSQAGDARGSFIHPLMIMLFVGGAWANYLKIESGPVSLNQAFAFDLLAVLILDPVRAAYIGAFAYLAGTGIPQRHTLSRNLANSAIIGVSVLCMGLVWEALGGYPAEGVDPEMTLGGLAAVLIASLAHFLVNSLLVYAVVLCRPTAPNLKVIGKTVQWDLLAKFVFAPLAYYIYLAYDIDHRVNLVAPMFFILGIWLLLKNTMELNQAKSDLGRKATMLEQIRDFSRDVYRSLDLTDVLDVTLRRSTPLAQATSSAVWLIDPLTHDHYVADSLSADRRWSEYLYSAEVREFVDALCHTERPLPEAAVGLLGGSHLLLTSDPLAVAMQTPRLLAIPLFEGSQVAGVLVFALAGDHDPDETALQTLSIIGMEVTQAIRNASMHDTLKHESQKRVEELALAEQIQHRALPDSLARPGVRITPYFRPARNVGGDYYDLIPLSGNRVALVIGDVSGKGIPAALTMMSVMIRVKVWTSDYRSPDRLMEMLNESLVQQHRSFDEVLQYSTAIFGVLDLSTRRFTYSMAGHERPLLLHRSNTMPIPLEGEGYPLGLFRESTYTARTIQLEPGDRLVLFTDGITDMQNAEGKRLSREGFFQKVAEVHQQQPLDFQRELIRSLQQFSGIRENLVDDQALLVVEITDELPPVDPTLEHHSESALGGIQPAVF